MSDWLFLPPWGVRAVAAIGAVLVVLLIWRALRERRTVPARRQVLALVLRSVVLAALLVVVLNPTALRARQAQGKPALVVLLDTSTSMATRDVGNESRLAAALGVLKNKAVLARLEEDFAVDLRTFDKEIRSAAVASLTAEAARGRATEIGPAVAGAVSDLADKPSQAGILLISDGRDTGEAAMDAASLALARSVPLWTWCLGGQVPRRDLWVEVPAADLLAFADSEVELSATFHALGYANRSFRVELLADGKVVNQTDVLPGPAGEAPVKFKITAPKAGEHRYTFHVVEDADEVDKENNERSVFLRVVGEKVRVLVVEGQPHWDTKFLVQCLKGNSRVELTALYRLADKRQFAVLSSKGQQQQRQDGDLFPRDARQFGQYDVIVLGRDCEAFFDANTEELLSRFVAQQGGGLIFSRGKAYGGRFQPLAKLEPVLWGEGIVQDTQLAPTDVGRSSAVLELAPGGEIDTLLEHLPHFDQATNTVGVKPLAVVLAGSKGAAAMATKGPLSVAAKGLPVGETDSLPVLLAYQHYGQGRVVTVNASGLWRWAFHEKTTEQEEVVYERFWSGLLRWLLAGSDFQPGADVAFRSDRRAYNDDRQMRLLIQTRGIDQEGYRPRVTIRDKDKKGAPTEIEPRRQSGGSYLAEAGPFSPGTYELRLSNNIGKPAEIVTTVEVLNSSVENRNLSADPGLMARLSQRTEGRPVTGEELGGFGKVIERWRARRELAEQKVMLWDQWLLLAAVLTMMGAEWFLRRREGLL
jgi:hypothetical protein